MSLWLQSAIEALNAGEYERLRKYLLPNAPIPIPGCMSAELEFAERRCGKSPGDRLFPIRFLWLMEAHEQKFGDFDPLGRSRYHPEKILELWERASGDAAYRQEREAEGFRFDLAEKAVEMTAGWVYVGERFVEDFLEVEQVVGVKLLFKKTASGKRRPAFEKFKR